MAAAFMNLSSTIKDFCRPAENRADNYAETEKDVPYNNLPMDEEKMQATKNIIKTLATGFLEITAHYSDLTTWKDTVWGTHPLKQLEAILLDPEAFSKFQALFNASQRHLFYYLLREEYFGALGKALQGRVTLNRQEHFDGFYESIGLPKQTIQPIVDTCRQTQNWNPFFEHLLNPQNED